MFEVFESQINEILKKTNDKLEKEEKRGDLESLKKKVHMYESMINVFKAYVKSEAEVNSTFNMQLGLAWKSAGRMLKFISNNAQERAVDGACFVPDDEVFDWVNQYYSADDFREVNREIEQEEKNRAEKEKQAAILKARKEKARNKALEELSNDPSFMALTDSAEKEKKIAELARKFELNYSSADKRKEKKEKKKKKQNSTAPKKEVRIIKDSDEEFEELPWAADNDESETDEELPWETSENNSEIDEELPWENKTSEKEPESKPEEKGANEVTVSPNAKPKLTLHDLDGQMTLFDIFAI